MMRIGSFILSFLLSTVAFSQSTGAFTPTGSMITTRFGHMSILLPDGKVLIAGGLTTCIAGPPPPVPCATPSSAVYDPAAGTFSTAGLITTANLVLGAALPDGRVLFAGSNLTHTQVMVEIYDPAAETFIITGVSKTLIDIYSAALLRDGRALLNGRTSSGCGAEFYDPVTAAFAPAVINWPPGMGGIGYPLAVLVDGRVLFDTPGLYDPAAGTFNLVSGLPYFDYDPASTVLINGQVLLTGGNTDSGNVNWAWLFDPATFSATGNMTMPRDGHTSTPLSDGTVLIAGSVSVATTVPKAVWTGTTSTEIYDPAAASFSYAAPMLTPRFYHSAVLPNSGHVLITGGGGNTEGGPTITLQGIGNAEIYTRAEPSPAPALFSLSGDGQGQAAIWHATTGTVASADNPAVAGEVLSMYTTSLVENGVVPPKVSVGGVLAETLYFGDAPGHPGYNQVNFRVLSGVSPGPAVAVWLSYLGRYSNAVTIGVQ